MGFVEKRSFLCKPIDVKTDAALLFVIKGEVPVSNLGLEFYHSPEHSAYAMSAALLCQPGGLSWGWPGRAGSRRW